MIDQAAIGHIAARLMEQVEDEYGEHAELVRALLVIEVRLPDEDDASASSRTRILWEDNEESPIARAGLVVSLLRGMLG